MADGSTRPAGNFRQSLQFRFLALATLPMLAVLAVFAGYFARDSISNAEQNLRQQGQDVVRRLAETLAFDLFSGNLPAVQRLLDFERHDCRALAVGILKDGRWLLVSGRANRLPSPTDRSPGAAAAPGHAQVVPGAAGTPFAAGSALRLASFSSQGHGDLVFSRPIGSTIASDPYLELDHPDTGRAVVVAVLDREPVQQARSRILAAILSMATFSLAVALLLAWRLTLRLSSPLQDISRAVAELAAGGAARCVPEVSHGELGALESGINRMALALGESRRDLEQRVRTATHELLVQKEAAEAAVQAKSRFLAAASHDLRQPLHALTLLIAALREKVLEGEARRLVEHIDASADALTHLFNALLDLSKLDAGVVVAHQECFPAQRMLDHMARQFAPQAREKGLALRVHASDCWLYSDPILLERILNNLVSNALCYTERGGVLVGLRRSAQGLRFEVRDTGQGIPAAYRERIFEEYYQLENQGRQRDKGLGLGLAIVSRLARLLGGDVAVESTPRRGSCFCFPVARCQPAAVVVARSDFAAPLKGTLVAFIEDDPLILEAMVHLFEQWGVEIAAGSEVESVCLELRELGRAPDLILSDYRLGDGLTGIEAVQRLRLTFGADIPAALISGDTAPESIQAITASGLALLHKPLQPAKLRALLSHLHGIKTG